jgi:protein tyrosine/serine phosphatase
VLAEEPGLAARFAEKLDGVRGVPYAARVTAGLYRGGQPDADGVRWLKALGIKTVINLRHFHGETERKRVEAAGMRYVRIPLESSDAPRAADVAHFLALVTDPTKQPIYVHCQHGVDRTGTMMAIYRMEIDGWNNREALAEMRHFGAHEVWRDLLNFVADYRPLGTFTKRNLPRHAGGQP